ncbi:hypothetical protein LWI29_035661 [Acer saccharum]|uniref:SPX domain-containing protein n=1 Tax=Acer saccharum TaxID=4024 RepID=A0AA39VA86_ACESA|nr:hypothetical protein LWI29_035661 [Acer saccharum]KAK1549917.1 hypothetical protein Q3G72_010331 [Acer saccharum]
MKFGKSLSNQIEETLPEWRDKFLSYKDLKKRLKLIEPTRLGDRPSKRPRFDDSDAMSREEIDFIKLLEDEMEKFNTFFVEKEEEYIITLKELQDRVAKANDSNEEIIKIRKEIVDFHGEMVLLENYSALNYTGLVKILKKYDKRTGALIRLPFIQRVLQQPFFTTDLLYKLVKQCETMLDGLFPMNEKPALTEADADDGDDVCGGPSTSATTKEGNDVLRMPKELAEIEYMESLYMKSTISAFRALKEIRSGSSTVSEFSLPPLQISGLDDTWKKIPVLEQEAK